MPCEPCGSDLGRPVATRACIDDIKAMDGNTVYIGRGCKRLGLGKSRWANPFKVSSQLPAWEAVEKYRSFLKETPELLQELLSLNRCLC